MHIVLSYYEFRLAYTVQYNKIVNAPKVSLRRIAGAEKEKKTLFILVGDTKIMSFQVFSKRDDAVRVSNVQC